MICGGLVTLSVKDVAASVRFYIETLGMKLVEEGGLSWAVMDAGDGFRIALESGGRATTISNASICLFPKVPIAEAIAIFENRGISFDLIEEREYTMARFHDLDGNSLYLYQAK